MGHSIAYILGMVAGIAMVAVVGIISKVVFKKSLFNCNFDERQELIRGRAFRYGFFVMVFYFFIFGMIADAMGQNIIPQEIVCVLGVSAGIVVFAVYAIWHDAYYALKENPTRFSLLFAALMVLNLIGGIRRFTDHKMDETAVSVNLIFAALFFIILAAQLVKMFVNKKDEEMD